MTAMRRYQLRRARLRYYAKHKNKPAFIARNKENCKYYYWSHRKQNQVRCRRWRLANREHVLQRNREWRRKNQPPTGRPKTGRPPGKHLARIVSLDNDYANWHEIVASTSLTPLEILMEKETLHNANCPSRF